MGTDVIRYLELLRRKDEIMYDPPPVDRDAVYYHGGAGGLKPGDYILPPSETKVKTFSSICREMAADYDLFRHWKFGQPTCEKGLVYLSDTLKFSLDFAVMYTMLPMLPGHGSVYRVRPGKDIVRDAGYGYGLRGGAAELDAMHRLNGVRPPGNYECSYAKVLAVEVEVAEPREDDPETVTLRTVIRHFTFIYEIWLRTHGRADEITWR